MVVAASSAKREELEQLLKVPGPADLIDAETTSSDAEASKPEPDISKKSLQKAGLQSDEAGGWATRRLISSQHARPGVRAIALHSGRFSDDPADLLAKYDEPPLLQEREVNK